LELESLGVEGILLKYLNRLSDHLFVLSRYMTHLLGVEEIPWKPRV
jgi:cob(I)alamin adenosyltransferase